MVLNYGRYPAWYMKLATLGTPVLLAPCLAGFLTPLTTSHPPATYNQKAAAKECLQLIFMPAYLSGNDKNMLTVLFQWASTSWEQILA